MEKNTEPIPDFDDLLFESRNKDYGAYQLRKRYNSVVIGGIIISSLIGCLAVLVPFALRPADDQVLGAGGRFVQVSMEVLEPPKEEIYVPPAPPPPENTAPQEIVKYTPPVVVDTIVPPGQTQATADDILAHSGDITIVNNGAGMGDDLLAGEGGTDTSEPFFLVEVMPAFRGGDLNKFRDWIQKRTNYPQTAIDAKIKGTVFLTFIVEKDGSVTNVTVIKGVHPLIDNEAVKAISQSPKWAPGLQRGQPVRVRYQISLNFIY